MRRGMFHVKHPEISQNLLSFAAGTRTMISEGRDPFLLGFSRGLDDFVTIRALTHFA